MQRIMDKCRDTHFSKAELQQLQASNFSVPAAGVEELAAILTRLTQQGPKHRLPFLLSKTWVKDMVPQLFEDEQCHELLLQPGLVTNEDFVRLLVCNLPREQLPLMGRVRTRSRRRSCTSCARAAPRALRAPQGRRRTSCRCC